MVDFIRKEFDANRNEKNAREMAAYLKTTMPFYGIKMPVRDAILKDGLKRFPLSQVSDLSRVVTELWKGKHREEKSSAIRIAQNHKAFITVELLPLYGRMIREGGWWDLVDEVAVHLVGVLWLHHPEVIAPVMDRWIEDEDLWIRRAAIIAPIKNKKQTDAKRLFTYCRDHAHEKDFFIRKGIGWALREYAKTDPEAVTDFLERHRDILSPLSFREAAKHLPIGKKAVR